MTVPVTAGVGVVRHDAQLVLKQVLSPVAPGSGLFARQLWMHASLVHAFAQFANVTHAVLVHAAPCVLQLVLRHVWQAALET